MKIQPILLSFALLAGGAAQAGESLVLPSEFGGFQHRGTTTDSSTVIVNLPNHSLFNNYNSQNGLLESPRAEVPINVPQFDGALGTLIAINITMDTFIESEIAVDAQGILDPDFEHEAGFYSLETLFGGTAAYPIVGLLQRPTDDPRGIAPQFYPIGQIWIDCYGIPADEESCSDSNNFDVPTGNTVNVFVFEDGDGPIYTLSDWIGGGFVPNFTLFIDNPGPGVNEVQYEFFVDNVDNADGTIHTTSNGGTLTVEYVYEIDQPDADGDGVFDALDNCINDANADQTDTNADGFGNACDPDVNNDGIVNTSDLGLFRAAFFSIGVSDTDFNVDGVTNFTDLGIMRAFFFGPPGPSGVAP